MSVKAKIAAGAATFALAGGGLGAVGTLSASAASSSCGSTCQNVYTQKFGPGYLLDVAGGVAVAGQKVILHEASSSDPAEDFVTHYLGSVGSYDHHRGLFTPQFDTSYAALSAYQFEYAPSGVPSGLCVGTWPGQPAKAGFKVRLEPCGRIKNVVWAVFTGYFLGDNVTAGYNVLVNAATSSFGHPLVMNYPVGHPNDRPRPWLNVQPVRAYADGAIYDSQQWAWTNGPVT